MSDDGYEWSDAGRHGVHYLANPWVWAFAFGFWTAVHFLARWWWFG